VPNETVITVRGEYSARFPAERATVSVFVGFDGARRSPVFAKATTVSARIRDGIIELHDPAKGPVTWWIADSVAVWTSRPFGDDGKPLPPIFHAGVELRLRFNDFAALARWIEETAVVEGVTLAGIEWDLTDPRRTAVTAEVRSRAVKDAVAKATVFAQSIGLGTVRAIALADPGMLGDQVAASLSVIDQLSANVGSSGAELTLRPEDIEVTATVDARFVAS
jgi:hypothetical protein